MSDAGATTGPQLDEAMIEAAVRARAARVAMARKDPAAFNEYVLRDEETGEPILNAPMHEKWHSLISRMRRLVFFAHVESGKTNAITIGRVLWELGNNPRIRIIVVMNTAEQAKKIIESVDKYIRESEELHRVFPNLKPGDPWTAKAITVARPGYQKDPSLRASGVHGDILGSRCDLLILDDVLDHENTRTEAQRVELRKWYRSTLGGRLTRASRIIVLGTAWHPRDLMHEFAAQKGWYSERFPVQDPKTGEPTWPERWPMDRIEYARTTDLGPIESLRQLDCRAVDESTQRFQEVWIKRCLDLGNGYDLLATLEGIKLPDGAFTTTGVDLAFTKNKPGAKTVFTTLLNYPDGTRQLLWIEGGAFSGPEIVMKAMQHHLRFGSTLFVETNGAQRLILDFATDPTYLNAIQAVLPDFDPLTMPVMPFQTGINKWHPTFGVESLAIEMAAGRLIMPNDGGVCHPEVESLLTDMREWDPNAHSGDYIMSLWFAREGARGFRTSRGNVTVRVFGPRRHGHESLAAAAMS